MQTAAETDGEIIIFGVGAEQVATRGFEFYEQLNRNLIGCLLASVSDNHDIEIPLRARCRYRAALLAICDYLGKIGVAKLSVNELLELTQALDELNRGIVRPFLRPAKIGSKVETGDRWRARAYIAIAASILTTAGSTKKSACDVFQIAAPSLRRPRLPTGSGVIELDHGPTRRCPLWVKSGHLQRKTACPLYPQ